MEGGKPVHFLLVEDDASHAELVRMALADNMVLNTLDHVGDGERAIRYLRGEGEYAARTMPDVILLDIRLPKIDGHEVLAQIKADEQLRTIPVIILTTSEAEVDRVRAYSSHANSYLVKPVDFGKFQRMVRDLEFYWAVWNQRAPGVEAAGG